MIKIKRIMAILLSALMLIMMSSCNGGTTIKGSELFDEDLLNNTKQIDYGGCGVVNFSIKADYALDELTDLMKKLTFSKKVVPIDSLEPLAGGLECIFITENKEYHIAFYRDEYISIDNNGWIKVNDAVGLFDLLSCMKETASDFDCIKN